MAWRLLEPVCTVCVDSIGDALRRGDIHTAVRNGDTKAVRALIEAGADANKGDNYGETPLHWTAYYYGHKEIVRLLIQARADIDRADNYGDTSLHRAANWEHWDTILELVARGAELTDSIVNELLFQDNPDFRTACEALADQCLGAIRDWCGDLEQTKNLSRDVIRPIILPQVELLNNQIIRLENRCN